MRSPFFFLRPDINSSVVIFFTISNSLYPQVCLSTYSSSFISARLVMRAVISVHSLGSLKKFASGLLKPAKRWLFLLHCFFADLLDCLADGLNHVIFSEWEHGIMVAWLHGLMMPWCHET